MDGLTLNRRWSTRTAPWPAGSICAGWARRRWSRRDQPVPSTGLPSTPTCWRCTPTSASRADRCCCGLPWHHRPLNQSEYDWMCHSTTVSDEPGGGDRVDIGEKLGLLEFQYRRLLRQRAIRASGGAPQAHRCRHRLTTVDRAGRFPCTSKRRIAAAGRGVASAMARLARGTSTKPPRTRQRHQGFLMDT